MKYCPNCGAAFSDGTASFCSECGKQLAVNDAVGEHVADTDKTINATGKKNKKTKKDKPVKQKKSKKEKKTLSNSFKILLCTSYIVQGDRY